MIYSRFFLLTLVICSPVTNESFQVFQTQPFRNKVHIRQSADQEQEKSEVPHPPDGPPPDQLLDNNYFATPIAATEEADESDESTSSNDTASSETPTVNGSVNDDDNAPAKEPEPTTPMISDETKEMAMEMTNKAGTQFMENVVKPLFEQEVVPAVPRETIKGAALTGAALAFLGTKGVVVSSAAGLSAAYVAISQGVAGDVFRSVGKTAWDVTEAATALYQKATANEKMTGLTKELADKVFQAVQQSQARAEAFQDSQAKAESTGGTADAVDVEEAESAFFESQEELARVLKEAETAIGAADAAIARADETMGAEEDEEEEEEEVDDEEEEARRLEEEARIAEEEAAIAEEEARLAEEAQMAEEARLVEEERKRREEETRVAEEEERKLREELRQAQEEVRLEEERTKAEKDEEETAADEDEDEWESVIDLAQQGIEGKIVGMDEVIPDDGAKADWDAAGLLAQELQTGVGEEYDDEDEDEDMDMEEVAKAAREAVDIFEQQMQADEAAKQKQREDWSAAMLSESESSSEDDDEVFMPEGELEDIARAAREAVELAETGTLALGDEEEEEDDEESFEGFEDDVFVARDGSAPSTPMARDWSSLTVAKLKTELRMRGLKAYGKKVELVQMLEDFDRQEYGIGENYEDEVAETESDTSDDDDDDDLDFDLGEIDLEELGRQARAAVDVSAENVEDNSSSDDDDELDFDIGEIDLEELGRQARAAVDVSEGTVEDDSSSDDEDWFEEIDPIKLAELGAQARAAADTFTDEPSDEILQQLEDEAEALLETVQPKQENWESMTVVQLKDELRSRGLRVSGKKAELIERLRSY